MQISVVVPVRNGERTLPRLMASLVAQSLKPYEIIVVDDGSSDRSPDIAREYGAKLYFTGGGKGANYARNLGVKASSGDIIAFTDSDCVAHPDWLLWIHRELSSGEYAAVAGTTLAANPESFWSRYLDGSLLTPTPKFRKRIVISRDFPPGVIVATCNFAVRRDVLTSVGMFDPDYRHYGSDDMDLAYKILRNGWRILCSPKPVIYHFNRTNPTKILRRFFQYGEGAAIFICKHPESFFSKYISASTIGLLTLLAFSGAAQVILSMPPYGLIVLTMGLIIHHFRCFLKDKKIERIVYPFLDLILALASSLGMTYMGLRRLSNRLGKQDSGEVMELG